MTPVVTPVLNKYIIINTTAYYWLLTTLSFCSVCVDLFAC